jgi:predicted phage-related endonuclease
VSYELFEFANEEQWLAARRRFITSSDVPTLLGFGYTDPYSLWIEKARDESRQQPKMRRRFEMGHHLEELIARWHEEETGRAVFRPSETPFYLAVSDEHPWCAATVDFIAMDGKGPDGVVEGKSDVRGNRAKYQESDSFLYANAQLHQGMIVLGVELGWVDVIFDLGHQFQCYPVERSPALVELILERSERFYRFVKDGTPPDESFLTDHESTRKALARIFDQETGEEVELTAEMAPLIEEWQRLSKVGTDAGRRVEEIKNLVALKMGAATYGRIPGVEQLVKWHKQDRAAYTVEAGSSRVMRLVNDPAKKKGKK